MVSAEGPEFAGSKIHVKNTAEAVRPNQANTSCRETGTLLPDEGRAAAGDHCCDLGGERGETQKGTADSEAADTKIKKRVF